MRQNATHFWYILGSSLGTNTNGKSAPLKLLHQINGKCESGSDLTGTGKTDLKL